MRYILRFFSKLKANLDKYLYSEFLVIAINQRDVGDHNDEGVLHLIYS